MLAFERSIGGLATLSDRMKAGESPSGFEGEAAMIDGFVAKPEHNGKCVVVGKYLKETDRFCVTVLADIGPDGRPRPPLNLKIKSCNISCDDGDYDDDYDSVAVEAALTNFTSGAACSNRSASD